MKNVKKILVFIFSITLIGFSSSLVFSQTCSSESQCNDLINQYQNEITRLQGQSNTLKNQISQFDAQIKLTTLKIAKTEEEIEKLSGRIDQLEGSLDSLSLAFSNRVIETYKMSKVNDPLYLLLSSPNLNEAFSRYSYLMKIQEADRDLLQRLQKAQDTYKEERVDQEDLQNELEKQKKNLDSQKLAKANLLAVTSNDEKKYQKLLSDAKAQLSAFKRYINVQGGASILSNQTKCDSWGCYYNQRDSSWGNMGLGGNPYSVAEYGCLVSSVSMVASHNGKNIKPSDIASSPSAFVNGTGYLLWQFNVNGINVSVSSSSKSNLDSLLATGKPVIAGLYGGPDHFIVILRKEGNNYIMHDPFMENGSNRPLTDKYNVSDITSLRLVSFN